MKKNEKMKEEAFAGYRFNKKVVEHCADISKKMVKNFSFKIDADVDDAVLLKTTFETFITKEDLAKLGELLQYPIKDEDVFKRSEK